jgi:tetratricopeptide (TPR) repeat protein
MNLANVEFMRRNFADALSLYERALTLRRRHLGGDHYQVGVVEVNVAETHLALKHYDAAMSHLVEAERIFARGSGHERLIQGWMFSVRGQILVAQRKFGAAIPELERALGLFSGDLADPINHALATWALARALHGLGRDADRVRSLAESAEAMLAPLGAVEAHDREAIAHFLTELPPRLPAGQSNPGPSGNK